VAGTAQAQGTPQPWLVTGDVDGFFGVAIDNLVQFLVILALCTGVHAGELTPSGSVYDIAPGSDLRWAVAFALCAGLFLLFRRRG